MHTKIGNKNSRLLAFKFPKSTFPTLLLYWLLYLHSISSFASDCLLSLGICSLDCTASTLCRFLLGFILSFSPAYQNASSPVRTLKECKTASQTSSKSVVKDYKISKISRKRKVKK